MIKSLTNPRISVNPLCEYVEATPSRRNSIIKQCKTPATFITKWYNRAEDILSFYLSEIRDDPKQLSIEIDRLRTSGYQDMERKYAITSAFSLRSFLKHELAIREMLRPYTLAMSNNDIKHKFMLKGVQISLRPELILRDADGKQQLGFVKFYFGKEPLSQNRGELMACLIRHYFQLEQGFDFNNQQCIIIDVYTGKIFQAPKSYKRRVADIEASCQEIADRWDRIIF